MTATFQHLLTASFHGSIIICTVLLLRLILKKAPKRVVCVLWMLAFIRLLMPFQMESKLSLQPEVVPLEKTALYEETFKEQTSQNTKQEPVITDTQQPVIPEDFDGNIAGEESFYESEYEPKESSAPVHWNTMLPYFWLIGAVSCLLYAVLSYIQLKHTVREAVKIIGCWECDRIETAFILGYFRPRIYVPMGLSRKMRKHILAHEWAHLQTGDHWFKLLAYLACCLHWFNPLVWLAYRMMCKDMEHACDERVVRYMNLESRKQYSHALLTCSTNHAHYTPCPVAFGEVSVKSRILSVLNYRKPGFRISLIAVIAVACVGVFLMTSPLTESNDQAIPKEMAELADVIHEKPFFADTERKQLNKLLARVDPEPLVIPEVTRTVTVSNVDEFLAAIAPNTEIILMPGTYHLWEASDYGKKHEERSYYSWGNGNQLELYNLKNFIISGSSKEECTILAEPSEADVLLLKSCSNIYLNGITFGHATAPVQYSCSGYALSMRACMNVMMDDLGLYGCGVIGLYTDLCSNIRITNSDIYDCSNTGISLGNTYHAEVRNCNLYDIGNLQNEANSPISVFEGKAVTVSYCKIRDNYTNELISAVRASDATFTGNVFSNNHVANSAFWFMDCTPVLDDNHFEYNELFNWYYAFSEPAKDPYGNELTDDDFNSIHNKADKSTGAQTAVYVSTVDEFLQAIAPDTEIVLSEELYDLSKATGYGSTNGSHYYWNPVYDGYELIIHNVNNMTIRSSDDNMDKHSITAFPRYANVLHFQFCSNINLSGFTAGHTETGAACGGGVIRIDSSEQFNVYNCGLFGCGTIGIDAASSRNLIVNECDIYECTVGGISVYQVTNMDIKNCTFRDLGGYNGNPGGYVIAEMESTNIVMDGEEIDGRIEYVGDETITDFNLTYNGEPVNNITESIGSFFKIVPEGLPENVHITWTQDNPYALSIVPFPNYCQVQIVGTGTANLTASCNGIKKSVTIFSTNAESGSNDSVTPTPVLTGWGLSYGGNGEKELNGHLDEFTMAVGEEVNLTFVYWPIDILVTPEDVKWNNSNDSVVTVEGSLNGCTIKGTDVGTAVITVELFGRSQSTTVHVRESW